MKRRAATSASFTLLAPKAVTVRFGSDSHYNHFVKVLGKLARPHLLPDPLPAGLSATFDVRPTDASAAPGGFRIRRFSFVPP